MASLAGAPPLIQVCQPKKQDDGNYHSTWNAVGGSGDGITYLLAIRSTSTPCTIAFWMQAAKRILI
ncbi:hypothetical protein IIC38_01125 [candidate division KSB1 bacterium]|nr:hypothetical protein [candidate division KSB1 bacterium]